MLLYSQIRFSIQINYYFIKADTCCWLPMDLTMCLFLLYCFFFFFFWKIVFFFLAGGPEICEQLFKMFQFFSEPSSEEEREYRKLNN